MEARKLFVGGLPLSAQVDELREHFGRYGEVLGVRVVRHRESGQGRGFAFVEFADDAAAQSALDESEAPNHVFGGRMVDVRRARVRPMRNQTEQSFHPHHTYQSPVHSQWYNQSSSNNTNAGNGNGVSDPKKVFVGGLRENITKEDLESYFDKFGTVTDAVVIEDGATHKSRGFGFISFDSEEAVKKVMETTFHYLNGTKVETKNAIPRDRCHYQDGWQYRSRTWGGRSPPSDYVGMYPPPNLPYIFNNHYMVPAHPYMYSPDATGDYGYMMNQRATSNVTAMMARQGTPMMYADYGGPFGYDSVGTNCLGFYGVDVGSDNKMSQVMADRQQVGIPATITTKQEPVNPESNNLLDIQTCNLWSE